MSLLKLDLSDNGVLRTLKRALYSRATSGGYEDTDDVTYLQIECLSSDFWVGAGTKLSDDELLTIFDLIGRTYSFVQEIEIKVFELPLPVVALNALLKKTRDTLQVLEMEDVILKGELEDLASTLEGHPTLYKVHFDWCQCCCGSAGSNNNTLEPVFEKLSTIPTLRQVKICGSILSVSSLRVLCNNPSLTRLSLLDDNLPDDGMSVITKALQTTCPTEPQQQLRELSVRLCGLNPSTGIEFANALRANHTLQKLEVRIKDTDWNAYGSDYFTDALKANSTLTHLTLYIDGSETDANSAADHIVRQALAKHSSLKSVHIALRGVDPANGAIAKAFVEPIREMVQTNTTLEQLEVDGMDIPSDVTFFLQANQAGRHQLLQNPSSHSLWLRNIIQHRHNVALTHYLLSMNPSFCPKATTTLPLVSSSGLDTPVADDGEIEV